VGPGRPARRRHRPAGPPGNPQQEDQAPCQPPPAQGHPLQEHQQGHPALLRLRRRSLLAV